MYFDAIGHAAMPCLNTRSPDRSFSTGFAFERYVTFAFLLFFYEIS